MKTDPRQAWLEAALHEGEIQLLHLIDAMPHMAWMSSVEHGCEFVNQRWVEYAGVAVEDVLGAGWTNLIHPDDRERTYAAWKKGSSSDQPFQDYTRIRGRDGQYRWFDTRGVPLRNAEGRVVKWFGTTTDIHDTVEVREALAKNEERLRYVSLASYDCVYDWSIGAGQTFRNETFQKIFGAPAIARSSERWWEKRIHPDDRQRVVDSAAAAFNARQPVWRDEYRLRRVDGSYANVTDRAYLLYDAANKPARMIGAIADITERKQVEQSLRDVQARLLSAIEGAQIATWIWDINANVLQWDPAAFVLWGLTPTADGTIEFSRTVALIHDSDRPGIEAAIADFFRTGIEQVVEFRIQRTDGGTPWLQIRGRVERDPAGKPVRMAGVYIDVTKRKQVEQSLRDAQARLVSAMTAGGIATWIWDVVKDELYWDDASYRLWGRKATEFSQLSFATVTDLMHPEDRERVRAAGAEFERTGIESPIEFRTIRPDGALQWLMTKGQVERDASGKPVRLAGVYVDITARKQFEQSLHDTQTRLTAAMQAAGLATWSFDAATDSVLWDEDTLRLFGRPNDEPTIISTSQFMERVRPIDRARIAIAIERFMQQGPDTPVEFRTLRPDGKLQWLATKGHADCDESGKPVRAVGVYLDITERKQIEQTLRDAQARLVSAMAAGALATWIWDIEKDEMFWDDATYRLWGREPSNDLLTSRKVIAMMHADDQERIIATAEYFLRTGTQMVVEFRTQRPDGALQWLMAKGEMQHDEAGALVRMAGVYVDITERKRAEETRLTSQKMEALGTLAGGIAHDFNNLLLIIGGNTRLALDDLESGELDRGAVERTLREVEKASARATDLVKRILTFSRRDDAKREAVSLRPLIEEALRLLRPTLPATIEIHTKLTAGAPAAVIDTIQLHQIVMNLVTNAAHAIGPKRGDIYVELARETVDVETSLALEGLAPGDYVRLSVRDTGCGIDPTLVGRIFDPFFTTKKAGEGTGLGLAVVHGIVKSQGGAIFVRSEVERGADFRVYLPAAGADTAITNVLPTLPQPGAGRHVLYVDDEEPLVYLITRVLERLGYRVTGCIDPVQALKMLREHPEVFDALVTDLSMRGMNGFDLTRAVRELRPDLPVLLTSGYLRAEDRDAAERLGIRELILKPNTVEELGQAIDRALAEQQRAS